MKTQLPPHFLKTTLVQDVPPEERMAVIGRHLDKLPPGALANRSEAERIIERIVEEFMRAPGTGDLIPIFERKPAEGIEVYVYSEIPTAPGDHWDTDWLEQGYFAENKGKVTHWLPKYPEVKGHVADDET